MHPARYMYYGTVARRIAMERAVRIDNVNLVLSASYNFAFFSFSDFCYFLFFAFIAISEY